MVALYNVATGTPTTQTKTGVIQRAQNTNCDIALANNFLQTSGGCSYVYAVM